ncbi:MAG: type III-A CRISPR-associated RAMP protein Csm3 [Chloroflexi bacterium]|nr:type III-A CRISPR-associated RAMP protein Csm3 [Chloroflexota bacterium]
MATSYHLLGRAVISGEVQAVTGLHIGSGAAALAIGAMDNPVIRDPLTRRPYIPGSSLKGKMRSLVERRGRNGHPYPLRQRIGPYVTIHICEREDDYQHCDVCHVFGVPSSMSFQNGPTRLIVRDAALTKTSADGLLKDGRTALFTEVKSEVAIDRVTSAANPRTMERVPAGAVFAPLELSFGFYEAADLGRFFVVLDALGLVEEDALGGGGSRGSGRVRFEGLTVSCRAGESAERQTWDDGRGLGLAELNERREALHDWLAGQLGLPAAVR